MSNANNSRPTPRRMSNRSMNRSLGSPCLWRLSGRYSSYKASTHRGWIWTRPQHFPQPNETEPQRAGSDNS
jgi:hypothetical protein